MEGSEAPHPGHMESPQVDYRVGSDTDKNRTALLSFEGWKILVAFNQIPVGPLRQSNGSCS